MLRRFICFGDSRRRSGRWRREAASPESAGCEAGLDVLNNTLRRAGRTAPTVFGYIAGRSRRSWRPPRSPSTAQTMRPPCPKVDDPQGAGERDGGMQKRLHFANTASPESAMCEVRGAKERDGGLQIDCASRRPPRLKVRGARQAWTSRIICFDDSYASASRKNTFAGKAPAPSAFDRIAEVADPRWTLGRLKAASPNLL